MVSEKPPSANLTGEGVTGSASLHTTQGIGSGVAFGVGFVCPDQQSALLPLACHQLVCVVATAFQHTLSINCGFGVISENAQIPALATVGEIDYVLAHDLVPSISFVVVPRVTLRDSHGGILRVSTQRVNPLHKDFQKINPELKITVSSESETYCPQSASLETSDCA
jgi:hypothetical protein